MRIHEPSEQVAAWKPGDLYRIGPGLYIDPLSITGVVAYDKESWDDSTPRIVIEAGLDRRYLVRTDSHREAIEKADQIVVDREAIKAIMRICDHCETRQRPVIKYRLCIWPIEDKIEGDKIEKFEMELCEQCLRYVREQMGRIRNPPKAARLEPKL